MWDTINIVLLSVIALGGYLWTFRVRRRLDDIQRQLDDEKQQRRQLAPHLVLREDLAVVRGLMDDHVRWHELAAPEQLTREQVRELLSGVRLIVDFEDEPTHAAMGRGCAPVKTHRQVTFDVVAPGMNFAWRGEMWVKQNDMVAETTGRSEPWSQVISHSELVSIE